MATSEVNAATDGSKTSTPKSSHNNNHNNSTTPQQAHIIPTSPPYPPYTAFIDPSQLAAAGYDSNNGTNTATAYVYPLSPQFSVQYYGGEGYQSYPGSPALHPQSPSINPTSPPFSPTFQYPYMLSHHQPFPPLHISSPLLTGQSSPGSPPHQYLPGPYIIATAAPPPLPDHHHHHSYNNHRGSKRNNNNDHHHQQQHQEQEFLLQQQLQEHMDNEVNAFHTHNIYVRGLESSTTDESFLEMCQVYGKIHSSKAIIDQKSGECKGYGFAMFENEKESEEAIEGLNNAGLQAAFARIGQESFSSRLRHLQDETSTNIYISNLPLDTSEQKLEELFHPYQTISNRILRDPQTGMSRGVGFARLTDREAASAIIERFNGHSIEGSSAPLQVRFADSPAQKKLKNQTARSRRMIRPPPPPTMGGFHQMRPHHIMPITPETMLGLAPSHHYYSTTDPILLQQQQQYTPHYHAVHSSAERHEEDGLVSEMEKINISSASEATATES